MLSSPHPAQVLDSSSSYYVSKEEEELRGSPSVWGGCESSRFLTTSPQKESVCCATTAVPGLSCTYRVPPTSSSQSVFSTGWYMQEGLGGGGGCCPEPIVLQPWQAESA